MNYSSKSNHFSYVFALKYSPDLKKYNIHGLWPSNTDVYSDVQDWCSEQLLKDEQLMSDLPFVWNSDVHKHIDKISNFTQSDFRNNSVCLNADLKFWQHEWDKHGVYSRLGPIEYFKKAIKLYKQIVHEKLFPIKTDLHHQIHFYLDHEFNVKDSDVITIL